jgi:hypothetical protein
MQSGGQARPYSLRTVRRCRSGNAASMANTIAIAQGEALPAVPMH